MGGGGGGVGGNIQNILLVSMLCLCHIFLSDKVESLGRRISMYLKIKSISERCFRVNTDDCDSKTITLKFKYSDTLVDIVQFVRSKTTTSLKKYQGFNKILAHSCNECKIVQVDGERNIDLWTITKSFLMKIYDTINIFDHEKKTQITLKFISFTYNNDRFNYLSITVRINLDHPSSDSLSEDENLDDFIKLYSFKMNQPYNHYQYAAEKKYVCNKFLYDCLPVILHNFPLKKNDQSYFLSNDPIFYRKNHIDIIQRKGNEKQYIKYTYYPKDIDITTDHPDENIDNKINCNERGTLSIENDNGLINPKCYCNNPYYGVNCEHIYYCGNCVKNKCMGHNICSQCHKGWSGPNCSILDFESLKMPGSYGSCSSKVNGRKCECEPQYSGKYCNIYTNNSGLYIKNIAIIAATIIGIILVIVLIVAIRKKFQKKLKISLIFLKS